MTINCLPNNGVDIKAGFTCTGEIEGGSVGETGIIAIDDGQGGIMYLQQAVSGADLFICFFIFIFTLFFIAKTIFNFLLPKMISIKAKKQ
jgi:hypothetical protein